LLPWQESQSLSPFCFTGRFGIVKQNDRIGERRPSSSLVRPWQRPIQIVEG
jgi:hypothetical protein